MDQFDFISHAIPLHAKVYTLAIEYVERLTRVPHDGSLNEDSNVVWYTLQNNIHRKMAGPRPKR